MPLGYQIAGAAGSDDAFRERVRGCLAGYAITVIAEAPGTADHTNRAAFAQRLSLNEELFLAEIAQAIAMQPAIQALSSLDSATDAQISTAVAALFNSFADAAAGAH